MGLKKEIVWRVGVVYSIMLLLGLAIVFKIFYLQLIEGPDLKEKAQQLRLRDIIIESNRGDILAEDGRLLATSIPYYEIRMDTRSTGMSTETFVNGIDSLAYCLSNLFKDKSTTEYRETITEARQRGERYFLIKRRVNYNQLKELKKFPIFRQGQYKGGLIVIQDNIRILPHANLAARTIGYITKDDEGNVVGIEGAFNDELIGVAGVRLMQKINGNIWMPVNDGNEVEPKDGKDVVTTLDINLQDVAESALKKQLTRHRAHHGSAVLMEVKTGKIKAIANLERNSKGIYKETYNYAVGESTVPGSTFKLPTLMAALEDGYVDLTDTIDTGDGEVEYYDTKLSDTKPGGYGKITVKRVFEVSSNVGMSKIINDNYSGKETRFINRLYQFNLNKKLGLPIKGEGQPEIKYPENKMWSGVSLPMMSIGYEVRLTPLQILTFYNAIANNGKMMKPMFVNELKYHGETIKTFEPEIIHASICSRLTVEKARSMLEGVVENGTARNLRNDNYKIAGKTGTAQIANKESGYRDKSRISYQASFVGYFPADNPQYSCIVVVNAPSRDVYYGNLVAGPVFKEIADKVYATKFDLHDDNWGQYAENPNKIPYTKNSHYGELSNVLEEMKIQYNNEDVISEWVQTRKLDSCVNLRNLFVDVHKVPNVVGMGVKDAVFILENLGLSVDFEGRGTVLKQSVQPGALVKSEDHIILEMSIKP